MTCKLHTLSLAKVVTGAWCAQTHQIFWIKSWFSDCHSDICSGLCTALRLPVSLWLASTIINSRIFNLQTVHLQIHLLSAVVSGDGESFLEWCGIKFRASTWSRNVRNPLQSFSFSLSDPADSSITVRYSCICTGQSVGFSMLLHHWFRLGQSLSANTWWEKQFDQNGAKQKPWHRKWRVQKHVFTRGQW